MENTEAIMNALQQHATMFETLTQRLAELETQRAANIPLPGTPVVHEVMNPPVTKSGTYKGNFPPFHGFAMEDHMDWLRKIEQDFRIYCVFDDLQRIAVAGRCFEGLANAWFLKAEREYPVGFNNSWDYFRECFVKNFCDSMNDYDIRIQVSSMKYNGRDSFDKFCIEFDNLVAKAQTMTEQEKVHAFINSMMPNCKKKLLLAVPRNLLEATTIARRVEFVEARGAYPFRRESKFDTGVVPMQLGKMDGHKPFKRPITCFRCGEKGHIARYCTAALLPGSNVQQSLNQSNAHSGNGPQ